MELLLQAHTSSDMQSADTVVRMRRVFAALPACAGTISSAAYSLLASLFDPKHGCMPTMAAAVLPCLMQLIVGGGVTAAGKRSAAEVAADRSAALAFVRDAFRCGCSTTLLSGTNCKAQQQAAVQYRSSVSWHSLRCYSIP